MGAFPGLFLRFAILYMYSIPLVFFLDCYSLVVSWCVTLSFWWTVPLFLLVYLCEVFLYEFIITLEYNLSTHFLKFF